MKQTAIVVGMLAFVLRVRSDRLFLIGNRTVLLCDPAKNIYEFHLLRR